MSPRDKAAQAEHVQLYTDVLDLSIASDDWPAARQIQMEVTAVYSAGQCQLPDGYLTNNGDVIQPRQRYSIQGVRHDSLSSRIQTPRMSMTLLRSPWMTSKPEVRSQVRATSRLRFTAPTWDASRGAVRTTSATSNSFTGRGASLLELNVFKAPACVLYTISRAY